LSPGILWRLPTVALAATVAPFTRYHDSCRLHRHACVPIGLVRRRPHLVFVGHVRRTTLSAALTADTLTDLGTGVSELVYFYIVATLIGVPVLGRGAGLAPSRGRSERRDLEMLDPRPIAADALGLDGSLHIRHWRVCVGSRFVMAAFRVQSALRFDLVVIGVSRSRWHKGSHVGLGSDQVHRWWTRCHGALECSGRYDWCLGDYRVGLGWFV